MADKSRNVHSGFTLIELLVVIAVIAVLVGVLLPALGLARASAWRNTGASMHRQMLIGLSAHGLSNDYQIPGTNTSGLALRAMDESGDYDSLDARPDRPVQNYDWISPSLSAENLPAGRLARLHYIMSSFQDPAQQESVQLADFPESQDIPDAIIAERGAFTGSSFVMPVTWQLNGRTSIGGDGQPSAYGIASGSELENVVQLPTAWQPNFSRVGRESAKIAISDGFTEYVDGGGVLDGSVWRDPEASANAPLEYGAFCSDTPINPLSRIYGDEDAQSDQLSRAFELSYRHSGQMNCGFFDGHVETLSPGETFDPRYWFPRGSIMQAGAREEALNIVDAGDPID